MVCLEFTNWRNVAEEDKENEPSLPHRVSYKLSKSEFICFLLC